MAEQNFGAEQNFDLLLLGSGPGGYVTAIRGAQLGMKVAVVERENLGGICLNWGCIPTKALLRTSEINHLLHHLPDYGFAAVEAKFDIAKVVKRSRAVAKQLSSGVAYLLKKHKVTVFDGDGKLAGKQTLSVTKDGKPVATLKAPHIILATGLPSFSTANVPLPASFPVPSNTVTLCFFSRYATPDESCFATARERFTTLAMSNFASTAAKPKSGR